MYLLSLLLQFKDLRAIIIHANDYISVSTDLAFVECTDLPFDKKSGRIRRDAP